MKLASLRLRFRPPGAHPRLPINFSAKVPMLAASQQNLKKQNAHSTSNITHSNKTQTHLQVRGPKVFQRYLKGKYREPCPTKQPSIHLTLRQGSKGVGPDSQLSSNQNGKMARYKYTKGLERGFSLAFLLAARENPARLKNRNTHTQTNGSPAWPNLGHCHKRFQRSEIPPECGINDQQKSQPPNPIKQVFFTVCTHKSANSLIRWMENILLQLVGGSSQFSYGFFQRSGAATTLCAP